MNYRAFAFLSMRVILIWLLLSICLLMLGEPIIKTMLPLIDYITNSMTNNFACVLSIEKTIDSTIIQCLATLSKDIYIENIPIAPAGYKLTSYTNLVHSLVPIVILYTVLLSWPNVSFKEKIVLCALGIIGLLIITGTVVPILLIGNIEAQLLSVAEREADQYFATPLVMKLVIFFETGGRWLFPILIAIICRSLSKNIFNNKV